MPVDERYRRQVALLVRILPFVAEEKCFALKGGTAINLFIRNLPRLSVDIDLAYLPVDQRSESLDGIEGALCRIEERITRSLRLARVQRGTLPEEGTVNKLFVRERGTQVKVEVTPVLRGCVLEPEERAVSDLVEAQFGFAAIQVVSFADLYAGKLVAALDRQHPRDLFDVCDLLSNEGIDSTLREAFVVYLISHHRPLFSLVAPVRRELNEEFNCGLVGMMEHPVTLDALVRTREALIADILVHMPDKHRQFLLSLQGGAPEWSLLQVPHARRLPAVRWQMSKLARLKERERADLFTGLEMALAASSSGGTATRSTDLTG